MLRAVLAGWVQRMFGGMSAKQTFKRLHKIVTVIDKTSRALTCPLFDAPMIEDWGVKQGAVLHAQMNGITPLHKSFFDYFHIDSF